MHATYVQESRTSSNIDVDVIHINIDCLSGLINDARLKIVSIGGLSSMGLSNLIPGWSVT